MCGEGTWTYERFEPSRIVPRAEGLGIVAPPPTQPSTAPSAPPQPPTAAPWPQAPWFPPAWPPPPRRLEIRWTVLVGALLVFFGYLMFVVGDALILGLPSNPTYEQFLGVSVVFILGEAIVGLGFLIALIGLALKG